jgi:hypothetical protein
VGGARALRRRKLGAIDRVAGRVAKAADEVTNPNERGGVDCARERERAERKLFVELVAIVDEEFREADPSSDPSVEPPPTPDLRRPVTFAFIPQTSFSSSRSAMRRETPPMPS